MDQLAGRTHEVGRGQAALTLGLRLGDGGRGEGGLSLGLVVLKVFRSGKEVLRGLGGLVGHLAVQGVRWRMCWWMSGPHWVVVRPRRSNFVNRLHLLERQGGGQPGLVRQLGLHHAGQVDRLVVGPEVVVGQHGGVVVGQV